MAIWHVYGGDYWSVELEWVPPIKWKEHSRLELDDYAYNDCYGMYKFERSHHLKNGSRELTYVGLAYRQTIGERVYQHPKTQLAEWKKRGKLWVNYAPLVLKGKHIRQRYEEAEHLLTYFAKPREAMKKYGSVPSCFVHILNLGWKGTLPKEIRYPVAEIY
jgi:hypothetical protein